jgi:hypothetical protein
VNRRIDLDTLWEVADQARGRARLSSSEVKFVRDIAPSQLDLRWAFSDTDGRS